MKVGELMTHDVGVCDPDDTLNDAAQIMWERDCGCIPVLHRSGSAKIVGIVTDRDICIATHTLGRPPSSIRVRDVMISPVKTCRVRDSLETAQGIMRKARVRRLPVIDDSDQLAGLLSLADLAGEAGREHGSPDRSITDREVGETLVGICRPRSGRERPSSR